MAPAPAAPSPSGSEAEWAKRLSSVSVSKATMDRLVMNWLVIEGYQEAAQHFMAESGTDAGIDLDTVSDRMVIRNAVQRGEIQQAIERTNAVDPAILAGDHELSFKLKQQQLVELIRSGGVEEALAFAQAELSPLAEGQPAFLAELERTMLLLAYDDSSAAPTAELLTQAARQKTASLLNAAILRSQKQAQAPMLPMMLRMLQWAQAELQERQPLPFPQIEDLVEAVPRLRVTDPSLAPSLAPEPPPPTADIGTPLDPPPPGRAPRTPNALASQPGLGPMAAMAHIVAMQDELDASARDLGRDRDQGRDQP